MEGIHSFFAEDDPSELQLLIPDASLSLNAAYEAQEEIGWSEWFKGRMSKQWRILYAHDLRTTRHTMLHQTPEKWASRIIEITWRFVLESWTIRNKLIRKILWQKDHIDHFPNHYLATIPAEHLKGLPLDNILMTDSQLQILIRASHTKQAPLSTNDED
jgi:hypothetical protein